MYYVYGELNSSDGKYMSIGSKGITLKNISKDEALWLLADTAMSMQGAMMKTYEDQEVAREKEEASIPPIIVTDAEHIPASYIEQQKATQEMELAPYGQVFGYTNCKDRKIYIDKNDFAKRQTVFHEVIHVALDCSYPEKTETQHEFIEETSQKLLLILQRNPALVDYLTMRSPETETPTLKETINVPTENRIARSNNSDRTVRR